MEIIVINSLGPMGSTTVAAILEKFGYLNVPVRKLYFSDYLIGKRKIDDPIIIDTLKKIVYNDSQLQKKGGVGAADKLLDSNLKRLTKFQLVEDELKLLKNSSHVSIAKLYVDLKNIYAKATIYKKIKTNTNLHIEMATGRDFLHDPVEIYKGYENNFDKVSMIHLHRPFGNWCNSIASQHFHGDHIFDLIHSYRVDKIRVIFDRYKKYVNKLPGLVIQFDDLFIPNNFNTIKLIAQYIDKPLPDINWENEKYDLYGAFKTYKETFNKFDDKQIYLSVYTRKVIDNLYNQNSVGILQDILTSSLYLFDLLAFKFRLLMTWLKKCLK
jgi:hypothetical protein